MMLFIFVLSLPYLLLSNMESPNVDLKNLKTKLHNIDYINNKIAEDYFQYNLNYLKCIQSPIKKVNFEKFNS